MCELRNEKSSIINCNFFLECAPTKFCYELKNKVEKNKMKVPHNALLYKKYFEHFLPAYVE